MRYRLVDIPALLQTPVGRAHVAGAIRRRSWPLTSRVALLHRRSFARRLHVVAVIGSLGKTTTARALDAVLGGDPESRSDQNSYSSVAWSILRIRPGTRHAVVEIGIARSGQMTGYARVLRPDIAVVTSIASEHNRSFGTLEATRAEKAEMVRALSSSGVAVLNGDDPNVRWMAQTTRARVITFGLGHENDVRATDVALEWPAGTRFTLHADGATRDVRVRLIGRHMVYPILAAVAVACVEGIPLDRAVAALQALAPTPGRMEPVLLENGAILLRDEYKSTLETIDAALDVLAEIPAERRIVVLGDVSEPPGSLGPIDRRLGERIAGIADRAVIVGAGFQRYATGATRAGMPRDALVDASKSVRRAVDALRGDFGPGDVVLIKGRDNQRLGRVALALAGRPVRCDLRFCNAPGVRCDRCSMLERGWEGRRIPT